MVASMLLSGLGPAISFGAELHQELRRLQRHVQELRKELDALHRKELDALHRKELDALRRNEQR